MRTIALLLMAVLAAGISSGQTPAQENELPERITKLLRSWRLAPKYQLASHLKPSFFEADFTGDGKPDFAMLIKERATGKIGVAFCNSGSNTVFIVGAGTDFGNGGDNFDWMDSWSLKPKDRLSSKIASQSKGDALFVEKQESASALIFWTGKKYVWKQQED